MVSRPACESGALPIGARLPESANKRINHVVNVKALIRFI